MAQIDVGMPSRAFPVTPPGIRVSITPEVSRRIADIQLESWIKGRGGAALWQPFCQKLLMNMAEGGFAHVC
ncbi:MAG: hypothetical protein ACYSWO_03835 [Planctomycetota bacterium]